MRPHQKGYVCARNLEILRGLRDWNRNRAAELKAKAALFDAEADKYAEQLKAAQKEVNGDATLLNQ